MDIGKILADLRQERDRLGEAIMSLERLAQGSQKRRGRPPAWISKANATVSVTAGEPGKRRRGRPPGSKNRKAE